MPPSPPPPSLASLNPDVLCHIFSFLDFRGLVRVEMTCKRFRAVVQGRGTNELGMGPGAECQGRAAKDTGTGLVNFWGVIEFIRPKCLLLRNYE